MKSPVLLMMAILLAAGATALKLKTSTTPTLAAQPGVTISIQELHRQADTRSLAVAEIVGP